MAMIAPNFRCDSGNKVAKIEESLLDNMLIDMGIIQSGLGHRMQDTIMLCEEANDTNHE